MWHNGGTTNGMRPLHMSAQTLSCFFVFLLTAPISTVCVACGVVAADRVLYCPAVASRRGAITDYAAAEHEYDLVFRVVAYLLKKEGLVTITGELTGQTAAGPLDMHSFAGAASHAAGPERNITHAMHDSATVVQRRGVAAQQAASHSAHHSDNHTDSCQCGAAPFHRRCPQASGD